MSNSINPYFDAAASYPGSSYPGAYPGGYYPGVTINNDPPACDTYSLRNRNLPSGFPGGMYPYIKDRYNVSVGQKCWFADEDNVYPCTIVDGSNIEYHADGTVSIGICCEISSISIYSGLYSNEFGAEDAHNRIRSEIDFEECYSSEY